MLSKRDTWVKAAVEHRVLRISYFSKAKNEHTKREVNPDYVGTSIDGKNKGYFTTYCHLRKTGPRCFKPEGISKIEVLDETFDAPPVGRWKELMKEYSEKALDEAAF